MTFCHFRPLCNLKQTFDGSTSILTAAAVTSTVTIPDAQNKNVAMNYNIFMVIFNHFCPIYHITHDARYIFSFQYNLKVKYVVTESPPNGQTTFEKSCTVVQTRGPSRVSRTTKTEATDGGEAESTATSLDFGTTYQSGDRITATCKVIETRNSPAGPIVEDRFEPSKTETMVAEDKEITIIAS